MAEEHIKINPVPTKVKYSGNGVVKEFPTGFAFFENDNIVVYHNGKIIKTGYSITGVGETGGGKVIFNVAPATGDKIIILRKVVVERVTDFQEGGTFRAKNINDELDRQTAFCQQIQEEIERCVKVEVTDDQSPEELLAEVYNKLDSATEVAEQAIGAANQATTAAKDAKDAVVVAQQQITETQAFIEQARADINKTVEDSIDYVEQEAVKAATEVVGEVVGQYTDRAETAAKNAEADASRTAESANRASASATSAATSASEAEAIAGEISVYNFKNKITNCITEIPQDIKLELNNGTLTLKAGSKVYVPNGVNRFDVAIIQNDLTKEGVAAVAKWFICYDANVGQLRIRSVDESYSGTSTPTSTINSYWYNTTDNKIGVTADKGVTWTYNQSFPLCVLTTDSSGKITSIDQVFNGFGYIGSTVFALPNVKGLIPNGRNADGSLKNEGFTVDRVLTRTITDTGTRDNVVMFFSPYKGNAFGFSPSAYYDRNTNFNKESGSNLAYALIGNASYSATKFTSLQPKLPFRAVDQNDFNKLDEEVVKTSGSQVVYGQKTFKDIPVCMPSSGAKLLLRSADLEVGVAKEAQNQLWYMDKTGLLYAVAQANVTATGEAHFSFLIKSKKDQGFAGLTIIRDLQGSVYVQIPTAPVSDNSSRAVNTSWVNSNLKNILIPNVGSKVNIATAVSSANGYTAPSSGFVSVQTNVNGATTTLSVGGQVVAQVQQYSGDSHGGETKQLFALVGKGQVVKTDQPVQFGVFVPFK